MPELPDVEILKRYADTHLPDSEIDGVSVQDEGVLEVAPGTLRRKMKSQVLRETRRTGKYLFVGTGSGPWLVMHFGMTGGLRYSDQNGEAADDARVLFRFGNGKQLEWLCQRKFGSVDLTDEPSEFISEKELGPDALEVSRDEFFSILDGKSGMIKPALMDQKALAGLGNVYTDELLYQCGIHPESGAGELDESQRADLYRSMKRILKTAINNKAEASAMPGRYLIDRRQEGGECPLCGGEIDRIKVSGRNGYYCPGHQKKQN